MIKFRTAACTMVLGAMTCISVASPVFGASAHNSQIGAAGPTTDPYSPDPVAKPGVAVLGYKAIRIVKAKRSVACAPGQLRTGLDRRRCD